MEEDVSITPQNGQNSTVESDTTVSPSDVEAYVEEKEWVYESDEVTCVKDSNTLDTFDRACVHIEHEIMTPEQMDNIISDDTVELSNTNLDAGYVGILVDVSEIRSRT